MGLIRFLLAISVVLAHTGEVFGTTLVGGKLAVQSFFIISGFYMSLILSEKYVKANNSYKLFLTNRLLRLYPLYLVVFVLTITLCAVIFLVSNGENLASLESFRKRDLRCHELGFYVLSNLIILGQDIVLFTAFETDGTLNWATQLDNSAVPSYAFLVIPQAWSLSIELLFYFIAPFLVKKNVKLIIGVLILSLVVRLFLYYFLNLKDDPWNYRFFPSELFFFLLGTISYRLYLILDNYSISRILYSIIISILVVSCYFYRYIPSADSGSSVFLVKEVIFLFCISLSIPLLFKGGKSLAWDRNLGELSYPIYISHFCVILFVNNLLPKTFQSNLLIIVITVAFAIALKIFIADKIETFRQARLKN